MTNKFIIPSIIVVILVIGAGFLAARKGAENPPEITPGQIVLDPSQPTVTPTVVATEPVPTPTSTGTEQTTQGEFSTGETVQNVDVQVFEVVYDGETFTPSQLSIKLGDVVIFSNKSGKAFRPASDPHPSHSIYPEFDAKKPVASGDVFEFKFTKVGSWQYHDHANASSTGTIVVQK